MRSARNSITHGIECDVQAFRFLFQNRNARLDVRRLQLRRHAPLEPRNEALLQLFDLARRTVTGKDNLLVAVVQGVEGVKKLLLRAFLAPKKLDIVNHQDIRVAILLAEFHQCAVLDGIDELVGKLLAGKVNHARGFLVVDHVVADGLQQVRLAQAASAVNEKGIVDLGGRLGDRHGGSLRKLVVRSDDKGVERVPRIHPGGCLTLGTLGGGSPGRCGLPMCDR